MLVISRIFLKFIVKTGVVVLSKSSLENIKGNLERNSCEKISVNYI